MGWTRRLLPISVIAVLLALPAVSLAGDPQAGPKDAALPLPAPSAKVMLPGGAAVAAPAFVPGASIATLGSADAVVYSEAAGDTVVGVFVAGPNYYWYYNSGGADILASVRLPAGATIWQVDTYGYRTTAGTQAWYLIDEDATNGDTISGAGTVTSPSGTGLLHATMTFPSGVKLAAGHDWSVDLISTGPTSGYVGAVIQYTLPALSLVPIVPVRVFDSRFARFGGPIALGAPRTVDVKDAIDLYSGAVTTANAIPQGAKAVVFNITVVDTVSSGYAAVLPGTNSNPTASTINWTGPGVTIANGGTVPLGTGSAERQVTIFVGGNAGAAAQVIIDISGYYQ